MWSHPACTSTIWMDRWIGAPPPTSGDPVSGVRPGIVCIDGQAGKAGGAARWGEQELKTSPSRAALYGVFPRMNGRSHRLKAVPSVGGAEQGAHVPFISIKG